MERFKKHAILRTCLTIKSIIVMNVRFNVRRVVPRILKTGVLKNAPESYHAVGNDEIVILLLTF